MERKSRFQEFYEGCMGLFFLLIIIAIISFTYFPSGFWSAIQTASSVVSLYPGEVIGMQIHQPYQTRYQQSDCNLEDARGNCLWISPEPKIIIYGFPGNRTLTIRSDFFGVEYQRTVGYNDNYSVGDRWP